MRAPPEQAALTSSACTCTCNRRRTLTLLRLMQERNSERHPPGDEIYRKDNISMFEVDGSKNKMYCQVSGLGWLHCRLDTRSAARPSLAH